MRQYLILGTILWGSVACSGTSVLGMSHADLADAGATGGASSSGGSTSGGGGGGTGVSCQSAGDCAAPALCRVCANGSSSCASGDCSNGQCVITYPPCDGTGGSGAGGSTGAGGSGAGGSSECTSASDCVVPTLCELCPDGKSSCATATCVGGKCVTSGADCGGTGGGGGNPSAGGATAAGGASSAGGTTSVPECTSANDCAVPAICAQCPNGTPSCATGACVDGKCTTHIPPCDSTGTGGASAGGATSTGGTTSTECTHGCAVPQICRACPNGGASCAKGGCVNGACVTTFPACPTN